VQGDENVRDRVPEGANRQGISGQGRLRLRPGEPDALKGACPVRGEAVGNVLEGNALAAYFIRESHEPLLIFQWKKSNVA